MKNVIIMIFSLFSYALGAQSISPTTSSEYCPGENIEFTVTITAFEVNSIEPVANLLAPIVILQPYDKISIEGIITFKFVGRFIDQNTRQTFRLNYKKNSNTTAIHDFIFTKIKSLYTPTSYSQVIPSPSTFIAPLCENVTHTISFTNVKYGNPFENPAIGYGTITNYEYLLPAGWKLGSQTSDGITWLGGSNSENITSDFTTAASNGYVQIRPVNTACGSGLAKNHITSIPISRPGPALSMSGAQTLCYPNNYSFTVGGAPANSSISWPVNSYYTSSPTGSSALISPTSTANGATNVKATITPPGCSLSFDVQKFVNIGLPYVTFNIDSYPLEEPNCFEVWGIYSFRATVTSGQGSTGWQWGYRLAGAPGEVLYPYNTPSFTFIPEQSGTYEIFVRPVNDCGTGTTESMRTLVVYDACGWGMKASQQNVKVFPNPASSTLNLIISSIDNSKTRLAEPVKIELYDVQAGRLIRQWNFDYLMQQYSLDIQQVKPGTYYLRFITKNGASGTKVIIQ